MLSQTVYNRAYPHTDLDGAVSRSGTGDAGKLLALVISRFNSVHIGQIQTMHSSSFYIP